MDIILENLENGSDLVLITNDRVLSSLKESDYYKRLVEYAMDIGIVNGFVQDMETADESFIPEFMGE